MPNITTVLSQVSQHPASPGDEATFPQLTERGPITDAYVETTATGLVDAEEAEREMSRTTSRTAYNPDASSAEKGKPEHDAKLVTFLDDDPENPRNFSQLTKWIVTVIATSMCFAVGISSSIITGGLRETREEFHSSQEVVNLTVCVFVIGFGVGPMFMSPLSELIGRKLVYLISMGLFCIFSIPCAVAKSMAVLIVFRFLAGTAASVPMCNAAGSIADVWSINQRGFKMSAFSSMLFLSPCLGPLFGGYMAMNISWRWLYWLQCIMAGALFLAVLVLMPESYAPTILARRAKRLRKETGDSSIMTEQERRRRPTSEIVSEALLRPFIMLCTEGIMIAFAGFLCLIYGLLYGFFFAYPIVFEQGHGFNSGQTGLAFLGIFVGICICGCVFCPLQENYYQRKVLEGNGHADPEHRLPMMMVGAVILPISLFIFAWTSNPKTHWAGAVVSGIPFGCALVAIYISANSYLVDTYNLYGASAMAAKTLIRSLAGASVPIYMYARLGNEWAGSLLAFISVGMAPIPFLFWFKGAALRKRSKMAS
ncbi:MFS general substrate transporter [Leucosporidium creatinivorum]|uniref:MFS general substrate transporter n=1 Tax=Leucosporidium creatinivorum TaxID=106004 RepID=A0A1Y2G158_9BASI|nr:MFS general substrate transporter [Leucosporidium creatinivorum]